MLSAAVTGLGWWGRHIVGALADSEKIRVVKLAARSSDKHEEFAQKQNLALADSYEAVLADPDIDAVILCTPHSQHEDQVLAAIEAGKEVFCEKPLALSKAGAVRMIDAAREKGLTIGVGHERRFEQAMEEMTARLSSGDMGAPMHIEANFSHDILAGLDAGNWRGSRQEAPAAGMTGMGVHLTDLFISMFGPVDSLVAQTARRVLDLPTGDVVTVQFRFNSGATGFISAVSATPYYGRFSLFADRMWMEARDTTHPQHGGETYLTHCGKDGVQHVSTMAPRNVVKANLEEWADALAGRAVYRFTDEQKVENVAVLEAVARSLETSGWVDV